MESKKPVLYSENDNVNKIYIARGLKVMPDKDLTEMYDVPASRLNEAVNRNITQPGQPAGFKVPAKK